MSSKASPTSTSTNKDPSCCDADAGVSSAYTNHGSLSAGHNLSPPAPHAGKEPIPFPWYASPSSSVEVMEPSPFESVNKRKFSGS